MNKNTGILIGVVALIVIVGGIYTSMNGRDDAMMEQEKMEQKAMEEKAMMEKKALEMSCRFWGSVQAANSGRLLKC